MQGAEEEEAVFAGAGEAEILAYAPGEVLLAVQADRPGLLFISEVFHPDWRATLDGVETPILRTAPAPLHALSGLARSEGFKVVLTGEGADEIFAGYNIFREAKVRRFWSRDPGSRNRSNLLTRLYPYLAQSPPEFLRRFYGAGLDRTDDPCFSHRPRWNNTHPLVNFLAVDGASSAAAVEAAEKRILDLLPTDFARYGTVAKAQVLEITTFLAGYLLNSQGDRMLMGNSVEVEQ